MLTIAELRLQNWKCFGGEHILKLRDLPYAIFAQHVRDEGRSNWLGKSSLLEGVDYVITGRTPSSSRRKSDWITDDAKAGEVESRLSDGSRILRTMGKNKPERVWFYPADGSAPAAQDEAEKAIALHLGVDPVDFWTCYFRQGDMAKLVRCEPSDRLSYVTSWIRLAPIQECEARASDVLSDLASRRAAENEKIASSTSTIASVMHQLEQTMGKAVHVDDLDQVVDDHVVREASARTDLDVLEREVDVSRELARLALVAKRYDEIVEQGKALAQSMGGPSKATRRDALKEITAQMEHEFSRAIEHRALMQQDFERKRSLVRGQFDGQCPVVCGACPAREYVEAGTARNLENLRAAQDKLNEATTAWQKAQIDHEAARDSLRTFERQWQDLGALRTEVLRIKPERDKYLQEQAAPLVDIEEKRSRLRATHSTYVGLLNRAHAARSQVRAELQKIEAARAMVAQYDRAARVAAAGLAIFGKNGAQRRIAEEMLETIQSDATEDLAQAGIPLSVSFQWSREGKDLAAACDQCGNAYPTSRAIKECSVCGAPRGPNLVNKLEFDVSNRSGGADDLGAAFTQFAASAWLRSDRLSQWATMMIDEPLGQLDESNRKAFSAHLPGLLKRAGFLQSLVIAHHAHVLDALPGRILVESDGRRSTVKVL